MKTNEQSIAERVRAYYQKHGHFPGDVPAPLANLPTPAPVKTKPSVPFREVHRLRRENEALRAAPKAPPLDPIDTRLLNPEQLAQYNRAVNRVGHLDAAAYGQPGPGDPQFAAKMKALAESRAADARAANERRAAEIAALGPFDARTASAEEMNARAAKLNYAHQAAGHVRFQDVPRQMSTAEELDAAIASGDPERAARAMKTRAADISHEVMLAAQQGRDYDFTRLSKVELSAYMTLYRGGVK